jgi:hypothetical protein
VRDHVEMRLAGGVAGGAVLQFPVLGPFSLLGGVAWVDRDDAEFSIGGERWVFTGSGNVLVKVGLGLELRDPGDDMAIRRLAAGVFVAPFYAVELPKKIATIQDSDLFDAASHIGVNFGVTGELPFARDRFALQLGLEDYLTFWSGDSLQRLPDWLHDAAGTVVDADPTHQRCYAPASACDLLSPGSTARCPSSRRGRRERRARPPVRHRAQPGT